MLIPHWFYNGFGDLEDFFRMPWTNGKDLSKCWQPSLDVDPSTLKILMEHRNVDLPLVL